MFKNEMFHNNLTSQLALHCNNLDSETLGWLKSKRERKIERVIFHERKRLQWGGGCKSKFEGSRGKRNACGWWRISGGVVKGEGGPWTMPGV